MLKIKDLKQNQRFYGKDSQGNAYDFKVWDVPYKDDGVWAVDCTDGGDYCFTFTETSEAVLYLTEKLED